MMIMYYIFSGKIVGDIGFFFVLLIMFYLFLVKIFLGFVLSVGVMFDFVSFGLIILTFLIFFLMILVGFFEMFHMNNWMSVLTYLFSLMWFLLVVFIVSSFLSFYLFFELAVVPIFLLVIGWGYSLNRIQAALYMFLYTFLSSLPLLISLVNLMVNNVSFVFYFLTFSVGGFFMSYFWWIFFLLVFMVKLPLFILHLWLPKAHVDAPLLGSMILAGVLLKLGGYGLYKSVSLCFYYLNFFSWWFSSFSLFGGFIMGVVCLRQVDIKSMIAYSSVVHMGPVFSGVFFLYYYSMIGSYAMMLSHGLCSVCLFYILNLIYLWFGSRNLLILRGGIYFYPVLSFFWFFFCFINMGCPPTFNFFSEMILILSCFSYSFYFILLFLGFLLVSGFYCVLMYVFFNHGGLSYFSHTLMSLKFKDILSLIFFLFPLMLFFIVMNIFL